MAEAKWSVIIYPRAYVVSITLTEFKGVLSLYSSAVITGASSFQSVYVFDGNI